MKFSQALRLVLDAAAADKPLDFAAKGDQVVVTEASAIDQAKKKLNGQDGL